MSFAAQAVDVVYGRAVGGVRARLERSSTDGWQVMSHAETDGDGQILDWLDEKLDRGAYRIVFDTDSYFASLGVSAAYPEIIVLFRVQEEIETSQIQVMLAPFSYSMFFSTRTRRGDL
jgi:5-hydroxyisourate hydrolase